MPERRAEYTMTDQQRKRHLAKRAQMVRYVVSVDHPAKSSFDTRAAADQETARIPDAFSRVTVAVADSESDSAQTLGPTVDRAPE